MAGVDPNEGMLAVARRSRSSVDWRTGTAESLPFEADAVGVDTRIDEINGTARFSSIAAWVHTDIRGWTLADLVDDEGEARLIARAERELAHFVSPDGTVAFPVPAIVATTIVNR
ncbi:MAG: hypothetical protein ACSLFP_11615 [Acidimicrobiales bacterium]